MNEQLTLDVDVQPGRTCPGCSASYGPRSRYAHDLSRRFCYRAECVDREHHR